MKKIGIAVAVFAFVAYCILLLVATASPLRFGGDGTWFSLPCDIGLVVAENECLLKGVDPHDVFSEKTEVPGYIAQYASAGQQADGKKSAMRVGVNPPWVYTAFMPLTLFTHRGAAFACLCLKLACLLALLLGGLQVARRHGCSREDSVLVAILPTLAISFPVLQDCLSMNWALVAATSAMLMAAALNRGHDILAGVCWACVMLKPQMGLAFAIPLLVMGRFKACIAAAATCLIASIPPSLMGGSSPLKMIFAASGAYTNDFWGCGTMPKFLADLMPKETALSLGLAIGATVCALMTWMLRKRKDWCFILMPAAACSASWTYARCYSHAMSWFFFICLAVVLARNPKSKTLWLVAAISLLLPTRLWNLVHMLPMAIPSIFPQFLPSEDWHYFIDSVNSTLDLSLAFWLCLLCRDRSPLAMDPQRT